MCHFLFQRNRQFWRQNFSLLLITHKHSLMKPQYYIHSMPIHGHYFRYERHHKICIGSGEICHLTLGLVLSQWENFDTSSNESAIYVPLPVSDKSAIWCQNFSLLLVTQEHSFINLIVYSFYAYLWSLFHYECHCQNFVSSEEISHLTYVPLLSRLKRMLLGYKLLGSGAGGHIGLFT